MNHQMEVVVSAEDIQKRVRTLATEIETYYAGESVVCVCVLKGAFLFFADLMRCLKNGPEMDFVRLSSYGSGTNRGKEVHFTKDMEVPVQDKHVLLIEDIVDSGRSVEFLKHVIEKRGPQSLKVCALVDKQERREIDLSVDFVGFDLTGKGFLVGYGLDYAEKYRELDALYEVINP
ncbi:MAG: hypoxanthine phosphoribosyltransferase [Proteobacteria bacterium]|nr:hypoxanthine phosphoribosyltransferase [Pseudomonadota bacterium]MBU1610858.1 hypoxanthine phosphoribosyltransferase [Pseudomonadota bacterium]